MKHRCRAGIAPRRLPVEATVADDAADDSAILERLVVLAPRTAAGENDPGIQAVIAHRLVPKTLSLSVSKPSSSNGSRLRPRPAPLWQGPARYRAGALGPSCGDVGDRRLHEAPVRHRAACATRSASTNPGGGCSENVRGLLRTEAQPYPTAPCRSPVRRLSRSDRRSRRAHGQYRGRRPSLRSPCRSIASTSIGISAFRRLPQMRFRCLPQNDYRLADRLVVDPPTGFRLRAARGGVAPQQPHRPVGPR